VVLMFIKCDGLFTFQFSLAYMYNHITKTLGSRHVCMSESKELLGSGIKSYTVVVVG